MSIEFDIPPCLRLDDEHLQLLDYFAAAVRPPAGLSPRDAAVERYRHALEVLRVRAILHERLAERDDENGASV
ncbi:MAG: hypothetical protein N2688_09495 [Burkholderiaceae bacterium]|nr:hypothetical protein [Burkholderiaceae bacterium]